MVVAIDGPDCPCGGRGCLEQLVSGRVLDSAARQLAETGASPWLKARAAKRGHVHAGDMDTAARAGDRAARAALTDAARVLLAGLRSITAAIDPKVIVLGGGLLRPRALLTCLVRDDWPEQRPRWSDAALQPAAAGDEAGLRGAAMLAAQQADPRQ
jgi:glucokinase